MGLLLCLCLGCGGGDREGERFGIYHLETAVGRPGGEGELRCGPPRPVCPGVLAQPPTIVFRYSVLAPPALTGDHVVRSTVRWTTDSATGSSVVAIGLTAKGREAFARLTREVARTGGRDQGWHHLAVVVGDEIVAFPEIDFDQYPDGFTDAPGLQIVAASVADARDLVRRLRGS